MLLLATLWQSVVHARHEVGHYAPARLHGCTTKLHLLHRDGACLLTYSGSFYLAFTEIKKVSC